MEFVRKEKLPVLAIGYDFDKTLSRNTGNSSAFGFLLQLKKQSGLMKSTLNCNMTVMDICSLIKGMKMKSREKLTGLDFLSL